jgi:hypothetical protein
MTVCNIRIVIAHNLRKVDIIIIIIIIIILTKKVHVMIFTMTADYNQVLSIIRKNICLTLIKLIDVNKFWYGADYKRRRLWDNLLWN